MTSMSDWYAIWQELRDGLAVQPPCPEHPAYPHVRTLAQGVINDIVEIHDGGVMVRSHRTEREDFIPEHRFEVWWNHLQEEGTASLRPGAEDNPHPWRSRIVGVLLAVGLPERVQIVDSSHIEVVG